MARARATSARRATTLEPAAKLPAAAGATLAPKRRNGAARAEQPSPAALDRVIHERMRLAIVSALAGAPSLTFNELKTLLDTSDGNLSVHARRLEEAGFIACDKTFVERVPRTEYRLTAAGRRALDAYIDHMESLIQRIRDR